jgi:opacity protein-like surface antigen
MKNNYLITDLGPHLLVDHSLHRPSRPWGSWVMGLALWAAVLGVLCWMTLGVAHAQSTQSDPMVMKVYPDGTKLVLRWSEVGKQVDNGEKYGGAPKIVAYDPAKDGIVPIGEPATTSTKADLPPSSSVISPEQPARMDYTNANPDDYENYGPKEGFGLRTDVGVAFQQSLSGRDNGNYFKTTFQPGIRFDIEPFYNITDWFSVGVQAAFIHNTIQSLSVEGDTVYRGNPDLGNGDLYQVPILLNTRFQFPSDGPIRGFIGAGVGGNWNFANVATRHDESGETYSATSYQWNYAFELSTGLCYTISPGFDLNASFKTLCTPNPLGEAQNGQMKAAYNYAALVGLAWRF